MPDEIGKHGIYRTGRFTSDAWMTASEAKPEATIFKPELLLSAESGPSLKRDCMRHAEPSGSHCRYVSDSVAKR
jgi:hypothetical protein